MPVLVYDKSLEAYDLGASHPLRPERFSLAVDLMKAYGLLDRGPEPPTSANVVSIPSPASDDDLETVHAEEYIHVVKRAGEDPHHFRPQRGIGPGDTPAFRNMHEASALACASTRIAVDSVLDGAAVRSFSVAGGLHHAHRDRAAGFCVYNDPAVAIACTTRDHPGLRVAYLDIDAHHGDGVQEAFWERDDVLTVSLHESGRYLFPGTGDVREIGAGTGLGHAVNVPLPPYADDACYRIAFEEVVAPTVRAFAPDLIVAQCGADAHRNDPLTHMALTVCGHRWLLDRIVDLADELCSGRLAATGGGGYDTFSAVPRCWANVMAALMGRSLADELPESWRQQVSTLTGREAPQALSEEAPFEPDAATEDALLAETRRVVRQLQQTSPLLG
jgi:acetoin utilization protein AcuC